MPKEVIADNIPFNSYKLEEFADDWDFKEITPSSHHHQSNGLTCISSRYCERHFKKIS